MIGKLHLLVALAVLPCKAASTTDFYFIDIGLGNATLIVASSGESLPLDSGLPETPAKIVEVAAKAGIVRINSLVSTHYHHDQMGGV